MARLALFVSLALVLLATLGRGQDFDLGDALDTSDPTSKPTVPEKKKPATPAKKPANDDGFNLEDAFNDNDPKKPAPQPPQPHPGAHDDTGGLDDADLFGGNVPTHKPEPEPEPGSQGMLAGIISSIVAAIVAAVSSFIAYQKKKLCFKAGDQENVNMESQQGAHAEPPVQRTLLQKS